MKKEKIIDHIRDSCVSVSIPMLIKQQIADKTPMGSTMKAYVGRQLLGKRNLKSSIKKRICSFLSIVPDNLLMQLIRERLKQNDCITQGWIMIGFPRTRDQAECLAQTPNTTPNRYECFPTK